MKKIISVLVMAMCLTSGVKAQFSNNSKAYCYEFVETLDHGMKTQSFDQGRYYFVVFYNGYMGYAYETSKSSVQSKVLNGNTGDYDKKAMDAAREYQEEAGGFWAGSKSYQSVYKYERKYSPGSKYSYLEKSRRSVVTGYNSWGVPSHSWGEWKDEKWCYTFSSDKKEMIRWKTDDSEYREYFRLIDVNSVKPNTDFLY